MKKHNLTKAVFVMLLTASLFSCKKDEKTNPSTPVPPPPANEQELITTFKLLLDDGSDTLVYLFKDPDGEGGIPAFYGPGTTTASSQSDSVIVLQSGKTYTATILFLDESKSPVDSIHKEVEEEADEHMIFFNQLSPSALPNASVSIAGTNLNITYLDQDGSSPALPLGLSTRWVCGSASAKAVLTIDLKHQPGSKNGNYAPGDTDISVQFKVQIN